jgi:hypothetical protein
MGSNGTALTSYLVGSSNWFKRMCSPSSLVDEDLESTRLLQAAVTSVQ